MRKNVSFTALLLGALLLPAVMAGSSNSPELTDAAGDAPHAGVDVVAAWFSTAQTPLVTTGDETVDCTLFKICEDFIRVYVKVKDFTLASPIADEDPLSTRYYYTIKFTPDVWGQEVTVNCMINYQDLVQTGLWVGLSVMATPEIGIVGRACWIPDTGALGDAFDVSGVSVSHTEHTLRVTLTEDLADIGPGTTFSGLRVSTAVGGVGTGPILRNSPADTTGIGKSFTM